MKAHAKVTLDDDTQIPLPDGTMFTWMTCDGEWRTADISDVLPLLDKGEEIEHRVIEMVIARIRQLIRSV